MRDLKRQLADEERREDTIVHQYIFGDLLIVFCGRHIKYTRLGIKDLLKVSSVADEGGEYKTLGQRD